MSKFNYYLGETSKLENAYIKFGDVMYVEHWFNAKAFRPPDVRIQEKSARIIDKKKAVNKKTGKPLWWIPAMQLECRRYERLDMNEKIDACIVHYGLRYPNIFPKTAMELERIARKKPNKDWRVEIIEAFEDRTYQRQGRNKWLLINTGKGYA